MGPRDHASPSGSEHMSSDSGRRCGAGQHGSAKPPGPVGIWRLPRFGDALRAVAWCLALGATLAAPARAADEDDPAYVRGRMLFNQCRACHTLNPRQASLMKGPGLTGIIGRRAGSLAGYTGYSEAMVKSGITWTPEAIEQYIASPATAIPGNNMAFIGLPKLEDRQAVVAYLIKATVPPDPAASDAPAVLTLKKAN